MRNGINLRYTCSRKMKAGVLIKSLEYERHVKCINMLMLVDKAGTQDCKITMLLTVSTYVATHYEKK